MLLQLNKRASSSREATCRRSKAQECFLFDVGRLANSLDKFKPFTPEHHIRRVPSKPREVLGMCIPPILKRAITFTLFISKCLIHFIEASLRYLNCLENGFWNAMPVQDYHHF